MALSPILAAQTTYPFVRLDEAKREALAAGLEIIDFGEGDPREPTPAFIRQALVDGVRERMGYPRAAGLPELRETIATWVGQRFGVALDPDTEVVPTLGSKEAIYSFAQVAVDLDRGKDTVVVTDPGYPVSVRGAEFARARVVSVPLQEQHGFLPQVDALDRDTLSRTAVVWVNYPNNPTGAVAPLAFFERLAELAVEYDFLLCSDEAYSELWFVEPPVSALQVAERDNVVAFNTLSKRSAMTGYRSGFVAASPQVIAALKKFRPSVGTAPQEFVQRAAIAAWGDEAHVEAGRAVFRRKRELILGVLRRKGWRVAASEATMYLWVEVPDGGASEACAARLLRHGIVVTPGAFLGDNGEGYVRIALVPTLEECERAAAILEEVL